MTPVSRYVAARKQMRAYLDRQELAPDVREAAGRVIFDLGVCISSRRRVEQSRTLLASMARLEELRRTQ